MTDHEKSNILIVDDTPDKLLVYQSVLEELRENVIPVRSGADALKEVLRRDFAVILLDVNMPGMDGFETAQLIRQRRRSAHTPIIFLTAFTDDFRVTQGYASGAVDYISTPIVPDVLRAKVRVFTDLFRLRKQVAQQAQDLVRREAAEQAARRSAFLAESSRTLANSLDFTATFQRLASVGVPYVADFCLVCLADEQGEIRESAATWLNLRSRQIQAARGETCQPAPWLAELVGQVLDLEGRESSTLEIPLSPLADGVRDEQGEPFSEAPPAMRSLVAMPLSARGKTLGAMVWGVCSEDRTFSADDAALAEEIGGRGSIALDNAMLVRDIQENDRRKNEFLAMLAHELRNPLAPIRNAHEILRMIKSEQPELVLARDVIDRQITHLVRLVDDLLDVSRITRGKIRLQSQLLDISQVLNSALEVSRPLVDAQRHELELNLPPRPVLVEGDPSRLVQVFGNLLNNAAKFTPPGGRISMLAQQQNDEVVVRVRDNGPGIPPEMLSRVFDLFTQVNQSLDRSTGGLGVGLTLVRRLVELHHGSVQALSAGLQMGSEFVVRLPIKASVRTDAAGRDEAAPATPPRAAQRVLLVDDNVDAVKTLSLLLAADRHEVEVAHNGLDALEAAERFEPHVVLLDIGLPGIDGYELARRLREAEKTRNALLIALTGYGQIEDRRRASSAGFDHFLVKPMNPELLQEILGSGLAAT